MFILDDLAKNVYVFVCVYVKSILYVQCRIRVAIVEHSSLSKHVE